MAVMKYAQFGGNVSRIEKQTSIPISRIKPLIKILIMDQLPLGTLLEGTELSLQDFSLSDKEISYSQYHRLVVNASRLSIDTSFALRLGEQSFLHHDGLLAGRIMSSENVEQSIELLTRYQPLFTQILQFDFSVNSDGGVLTLSPLFELEEALPYFMAYTCSVIYSLGRFFLGGIELTPAMAEMHFSYPEPETRYVYDQFFSVPVLFNQASNCIVFSRSLLDMPLIFSNKENAQKRDRICQARVSEIAPDDTVLDRVKFIIHKQIQTNPSLEKVAESLCISPRTLRRHLQIQRTSYKALVEEERKRLALSQIRKPEISIENLARSLGYGDSSSFSRAFKRWYGVSPKRYR